MKTAPASPKLPMVVLVTTSLLMDAVMLIRAGVIDSTTTTLMVLDTRLVMASVVGWELRQDLPLSK